MANKTISKTIRLSEEDFNYINSFGSGSSFNEKLDCLLKLMYQDVPTVQKQVSDLNTDYQRSLNDYIQLQQRITKLRSLIRESETLYSNIQRVSEMLLCSFPEVANTDFAPKT